MFPDTWILTSPSLCAEELLVLAGTLGQGSSGLQQPGLNGLENKPRDGVIGKNKAEIEGRETAHQLVGF